MENKSAYPGYEWVVVSKRRIYTIVALLGLTPLVLAAGLYLWLYPYPASSLTRASGETGAARFDTFEGEVRVVRAATRESVVVDAATRLYAGDLVQTRATGRAGITLADGSTLTIGPDSVLTLTEDTAAPAAKDGHVRVVVEGGQVKMSTEKRVGAGSNVVETSVTRNSLSAQTVASFDVHEDRSEEIRVGKGAVESSTAAGRTTIRGGEYVAYGRDGDIRRRERLLDTPVPYAPADLERINARPGGGATVSLQWTQPMTANARFYQVEIASSPFFVAAGIVFERGYLVAPNLTVSGLQAGNYFWRVRAASAAGQTTEWSGPQKFVVVRGEAPKDAARTPDGPTRARAR